MNFTAIVHGSIGHIIVDYLHLQPLALYARCNKNAHALVEYRYSHFKELDLDEYMQDRESSNGDVRFISLCARLRGIEVLQWSENHCQLLWRLPYSSKGKLIPHYSALSHFYSELILGNASRLRVITVRSSSNYTTRQLLDRDIREYFNDPIMALVNYLPQLEVLDLVDIGEDEIDQLYKRQQNIIIIPQLDTKTPTIDARDHTPTLIEMMPKKLQNSMRTTLQHISNQSDSMSLIQPHPLQHLRILSFVSLRLNQFRTLVSLLPQIEVAIVSLAMEEEQVSTQLAATAIISHTDIAPPCSLIFRLPSEGGNIILPLWSQLKCFSLHCNIYSGIPLHTIIEIHSPDLLGLNLQSDDDMIADVIFKLPQALSIGIHLTCIQPQHKNLDSKNKEEDDLLLPLPPSLISSLRHSQRLRSLIASPIKSDAAYTSINEDWRLSLTNEEHMRLIEKLSSERLLNIEVSKDQHDKESSMLLYHQRLFLYALSTLPCASTLELIDGAPHRGDILSMSEFLLLFPAIRSITLTPYFPSSIPEWFRPNIYRAIGSWNLIEGQYTQACMKKKKFDSHFECDDYWQIAQADIEIDHTIGELINRSDRFNHLITLFLSTPTQVAESALTAIFIRCQQLCHVSLIQLVGIGNSLFTNLPQDCIRSSLRTLRLKNPCHDNNNDDDDSTDDNSHPVSMQSTDSTTSDRVSIIYQFDSLILETLIRVFPSIVHFDFVSPTQMNLLNNSDSSTQSTLIHLLQIPTLFDQKEELANNSVTTVTNLALIDDITISTMKKNIDTIMKWPHLRILSLSRSLRLVVSEKNTPQSDELTLHQLLIDRIIRRTQHCRAHDHYHGVGDDPAFSTSYELACELCELNFVTIRPEPGVNEDDWINSSRSNDEKVKMTDLKQSSTSAGIINSILAYHTEPCCQAHLCSMKKHRALAIEEDEDEEDEDEGDEEDDEEDKDEEEEDEEDGGRIRRSESP